MRKLPRVRRRTRAYVGLLAALVGCGGTGGATEPTYPAEGRVLLASDRPLTGGRVALVPEGGLGTPASGEISPDGSFRLTTREPGDGAPAGRYKVRIEPPPPAGKARKPAFPLKYVDEDSSGLVLTIRPESNRLGPIRLK